MQFPGCALWLDADDLTSLTFSSGTNVSVWKDKSGNGRNLTSFLAGTGSITRSTYGGVDSILFNSTVPNTAYMRVNSSVNLTNFTLFAVSRCQASRGNQNGLLAIPSTSYEWNSTDGFGMFIDSDVPRDRFYGSGVGNVVFNSHTAGVDRYPLRSVCWINTSSGDLSTWFDGNTGPTSSGSARTSTATGFGIGFDIQGSAGSIENLTCISQFSEFIVYTNVLTSAQRQQVEGYLAQKWGLLGSMPASHPFRETRLFRAAPFLPYRVLIPFFRPTQISGCSIWLDAADATTFSFSTGTSNITQWRDKSGNSRHINRASQSSSHAVLTPTFQNNLPVLNFSRSVIYTTAASGAVYPLEVYIVLALKNVTEQIDVCAITTGTTSDNFNSLTYSEYTGRRWHNGSSSFARTPDTVSPSDETSTSFLLMQWSIANNSFIIRRNGVVLSSTASYTFTPSTGSVFQIGWRQSFASFTGEASSFNGYIAEVVVFNTQLQTTQRQQVESYLAQKWGLRTNLPAVHIDKTQPSLIPLQSNQIIRRIRNIPPPPFIIKDAILGVDYTITTDGKRDYYNFLATGKTMTVTTTVPRIVDYFALAGGGGGGGYWVGGGGGAGGLKQGIYYSLPAGTYTVIIGAGGSGGSGSTSGNRGANGGDTVFGSIATAFGGGGGGSFFGNESGLAGGCGGGAAGSSSGNFLGGTGSQGSEGGGNAYSPPRGGGGGGVTSAGITGGNGGDGITFNNGTVLQLGGGGGAGSDGTGSSGVFGGGNGASLDLGKGGDAGINTGAGGGGAGGGDGSTGTSGGNGGSGIFILSVNMFTFPSVTVTQSFYGNGTIQTFTVPAGVTAVRFFMWGAGGNNQDQAGTSGTWAGGSAGYVGGILQTTPGTVYSIIVGRNGVSGLANGGGTLGTYGGGGGGFSGIFSASPTFNSVIAIAGGGGGAGTNATGLSGGGGGYPAGSAATNSTSPALNGGGGGTQKTGGTGITTGLQLQGGAPADFYKGGGGGGYYGGGSGDGINPSTGGGGGSSTYIVSVVNPVTFNGSIGITTAGNTPAANEASPYWQSPFGRSAASGLVVIGY